MPRVFSSWTRPVNGHGQHLGRTSCLAAMKIKMETLIGDLCIGNHGIIIFIMELCLLTGSLVHLAQGGLTTLTIVSEHTALFIPTQEAAPESPTAGDESSRSKFFCTLDFPFLGILFHSIWYGNFFPFPLQWGGCLSNYMHHSFMFYDQLDLLWISNIWYIICWICLWG